MPRWIIRKDGCTIRRPPYPPLIRALKALVVLFFYIYLRLSIQVPKAGRR